MLCPYQCAAVYHTSVQQRCPYTLSIRTPRALLQLFYSRSGLCQWMQCTMFLCPFLNAYCVHAPSSEHRRQCLLVWRTHSEITSDSSFCPPPPLYTKQAAMPWQCFVVTYACSYKSPLSPLTHTHTHTQNMQQRHCFVFMCSP